MYPPEFRERAAISSGAGKGIGQATAIAFASLGARVILSGQTEKPLTETLGLIEKAGGTAVVVGGDVATESAAQDTVATALRTFGRLDFAVTNAGVSPWTVSASRRSRPVRLTRHSSATS